MLVQKIFQRIITLIIFICSLATFALGIATAIMADSWLAKITMLVSLVVIVLDIAYLMKKNAKYFYYISYFYLSFLIFAFFTIIENLVEGPGELIMVTGLTSLIMAVMIATNTHLRRNSHMLYAGIIIACEFIGMIIAFAAYFNANAYTGIIQVSAASLMLSVLYIIMLQKKNNIDMAKKAKKESEAAGNAKAE